MFYLFNFFSFSFSSSSSFFYSRRTHKHTHTFCSLSGLCGSLFDFTTFILVGSLYPQSFSSVFNPFDVYLNFRYFSCAECSIFFVSFSLFSQLQSVCRSFSSFFFWCNAMKWRTYLYTTNQALTFQIRFVSCTSGAFLHYIHVNMGLLLMIKYYIALYNFAMNFGSFQTWSCSFFFFTSYSATICFLFTWYFQPAKSY